MTALIKRALGDSCGEVDDSADLESVIAKLELKFQLIFPRRTKEQTVETTKVSTSSVFMIGVARKTF